jgi:hypothetical protein
VHKRKLKGGGDGDGSASEDGDSAPNDGSDGPASDDDGGDASADAEVEDAELDAAAAMTGTWYRSGGQLVIMNQRARRSSSS